MHPVLAALAERPPGARLALVVEGGGMRGAVTGGMAQALHEHGLGEAFDAAYGSSAGTLNALARAGTSLGSTSFDGFPNELLFPS